MQHYAIACNICGKPIEKYNPNFLPQFCEECAMRLREILYQPEPTNYEYALQIIADMFDPPCSYSYKGHDGVELLMEHAEGFCEECDNRPYAECWRKYFEILRRMEATK